MSNLVADSAYVKFIYQKYSFPLEENDESTGVGFPTDIKSAWSQSQLEAFRLSDHTENCDTMKQSVCGWLYIYIYIYIYICFCQSISLFLKNIHTHTHTHIYIYIYMKKINIYIIMFSFLWIDEINYFNLRNKKIK